MGGFGSLPSRGEPQARTSRARAPARCCAGSTIFSTRRARGADYRRGLRRAEPSAARAAPSRSALPGSGIIWSVIGGEACQRKTGSGEEISSVRSSANLGAAVFSSAGSGRSTGQPDGSGELGCSDRSNGPVRGRARQRENWLAAALLDLGLLEPTLVDSDRSGDDRGELGESPDVVGERHGCAAANRRRVALRKNARELERCDRRRCRSALERGGRGLLAHRSPGAGLRRGAHRGAAGRALRGHLGSARRDGRRAARRNGARAARRGGGRRCDPRGSAEHSG